MERIEPRTPLEEMDRRYPLYGRYIWAPVQLAMKSLGRNPEDPKDEAETMQRLHDGGDIMVFGRREQLQFLVLHWHQDSKGYMAWENSRFPEIIAFPNLEDPTIQPSWEQHFSSSPELARHPHTPEKEETFLHFLNEDETRAVMLAWQPEEKYYEVLRNGAFPLVFERTKQEWRVLNLREESEGMESLSDPLR